MGRLIAGAAATDITPEDSQFLFGYPHVPRYSTGVLDRLFSSALYLSDGHTGTIFVANDAIFVTRGMAARVRERIAPATDVPAANILLSATHTHSAPKTVDYISNANDPVVPPVDPAYLAFLETQMAEVAIAAHRSARPADAGLVVADGSAVGTNRRDPSGPADPQVPALLVREAATGTPIACMIVVSMHPTVLREDSFLVSADFPGYTRRFLQEQFLGKDVPILHHTGPSGNQSPRHVVNANTPAEAVRLGTALGQSVAAALKRVQFRSDLAVAVVQGFAELPRRPMPDAERAEHALADAAAHLAQLRAAGASRQAVRKAEVDWFGAEETVTLAQAAADRRLEAFYNACMPAEVQVIGLGPWAFVGWPGEVFVEHALALKAHRPNTYVISMANGELQGYIATEEAAAEGGYEATNALFAPESGAILVNQSLRILQELDEKALA